MSMVVDSSVAVAWLMPDESNPVADQAWPVAIASGILVPPLFAYEVRNVIVVNERRGRLSEKAANAALSLLAELPITADKVFEGDALIALARAHRLTVYDAAYLELAIRRKAQLATLDNALRQAAEAEGVA